MGLCAPVARLSAGLGNSLVSLGVKDVIQLAVWWGFVGCALGVSSFVVAGPPFARIVTVGAQASLTVPEWYLLGVFGTLRSVQCVVGGIGRARDAPKDRSGGEMGK